MIKIRELRIGNWVQHQPHPEEMWQVDYKILEAIDLQLVYCEGIKITHEVLLACGFEIDKDWITRKEGTIYVMRQKTESWVWVWIRNQKGVYRFVMSVNLFYVDISRPIPYLHDVQNVYHSLTGEELVFTPHVLVH